MRMNQRIIITVLCLSGVVDGERTSETDDIRMLTGEERARSRSRLSSLNSIAWVISDANPPSLLRLINKVKEDPSLDPPQLGSSMKLYPLAHCYSLEAGVEFRFPHHESCVKGPTRPRTLFVSQDFNKTAGENMLFRFLPRNFSLASRVP